MSGGDTRQEGSQALIYNKEKIVSNHQTVEKNLLGVTLGYELQSRYTHFLTLKAHGRGFGNRLADGRNNQLQFNIGNSSSVAEVIQLLLLSSFFIYKSAIVPADVFQLPAHRQALIVIGHCKTTTNRQIFTYGIHFNISTCKRT